MLFKKIFLIITILITIVSITIAEEELNTTLIITTTIRNQTKEKIDSLPLHTVVISTLFYALTSVVGLIGNSLVIIIVCFNKSLQHNTNYCLVNLSVADLILIIVCMPSAIVSRKELNLFSSKKIVYRNN
jgi:hypothetical protein